MSGDGGQLTQLLFCGPGSAYQEPSTRVWIDPHMLVIIAKLHQTETALTVTPQEPRALLQAKVPGSHTAQAMQRSSDAAAGGDRGQ